MITETIIATGTVGTALAAKAYSNIFALRVNTVELGYHNLPRALDGFKILHLTDLHVRKWGSLEAKTLAAIENTQADLIVFTGDLVTSSNGMEPFCRLLKASSLKCPTFITYGNTEHKYWSRKKITKKYTEAGATVLVNDSRPLERGGERLFVVGVDDPFTGHAEFPKAFDNVPEDAFKVLLAHSPQVADLAVEHQVSLMMSGHTHGGQVRLPVVGALRKHLPRYKQLVMGLFEGKTLGHVLGKDPGDLKVYVSRGIGTSYLPARVLCPPEIPLYILRNH